MSRGHLLGQNCIRPEAAKRHALLFKPCPSDSPLAPRLFGHEGLRQALAQKIALWSGPTEPCLHSEKTGLDLNPIVGDRCRQSLPICYDAEIVSVPPEAISPGVNNACLIRDYEPGEWMSARLLSAFAAA